MELGMLLGTELGTSLGVELGVVEGASLGEVLGSWDGEMLGMEVGLRVGKGDGMGEGGLVGSALGDTEMVGAGVSTGSWQLHDEDLHETRQVCDEYVYIIHTAAIHTFRQHIIYIYICINTY